ncbi:helicase [Streptomyces sp. NRRL F-2580]|uniref:helicase n=1 Tax=Streptomyces sp. NRRL F-2580 TaxID=1463841 RepID=UPI000AB33919|nr:helicase [Streptomyces sp. NRRL F-2580]
MPGRAVVELLPDGTEHRSGICIGNHKTRRGRLDPARLRALAEAGVDWAAS